MVDGDKQSLALGQSTASRRKLAAILSADVVGYSRLMADDERATIECITAYRDIIRRHVERHGGRVVDSPGDALLAEFPSAVEALECAQEVQQQLAKRNAQFADHRRMQFRIGINLGDVIEENGCLYGDGVNVAARLESLCEPGGVCISGAVFDQVEGKLPLAFKFAGEQPVKNISMPVRVYHLVQNEQRLERRSGTRKRRIAALVAAVALIAVGAIAWEITHPRKASDASAASDPVLAMPTGPRVAVLPFQNMGGNSEDEYLSDGLTEDIITELARYRELQILARNITYQYKNQAVDIPAVGRKLGADYILEGSIRRADKRLRVTAQLIDVRNGAHIWAERYDREFTDVFLVQEEIATRVSGSIAGGWSGSLYAARVQDAQRMSPDQLRAYDLVLQHTSFYVTYTPEAYAKAKSLLQRAMALDPGYAGPNATMRGSC